MGTHRRKNSPGGIKALVAVGILFLLCGVGYGKYIYDGGSSVWLGWEMASESEAGSQASDTNGLTVGALHDVQEGNVEESTQTGGSIGADGDSAENQSGSEEESTSGSGDESDASESGSGDESDASESGSGDESDVSESGSGDESGAIKSGSGSSDLSEDTEITLVMIGDMLMHTSVVDSGEQEDGSYNYDHLFANVADRIASADIAIVNQETIMGGDDRGFSGYPTFNSPTALADAEAAVGFDVILHGTNHALDKGASGVLNCINYWETNYPDIAYLGINKSQEAQDTYIYVYEQDGISIAILNYTYGTNGISTPADQPYLVNYLEEDKVVSDIERAHELADFVIVCPHWGTEYNLGTDSSQAKWTQIFLEAGVDLVIGTHPHVIEPVEWVTDDEGNEMLVYYSLGNFVNGTSSSGSGVTSRMVGGMAEVTIGVENGEVVILEYDAIPLVCHIASGSDFTVYYLSDYTEELAQENRIVSQDAEFSLAKCWEVVEEVWGE